ncbi:hypothetical protein RJT34_06724 [Clitoria ternatea]|uniref:Uncharacterized protein n=1 Tax=Clitoria ternatea TaxID=43366 RepID=A0AAN9K419_CLITE
MSNGRMSKTTVKGSLAMQKVKKDISILSDNEGNAVSIEAALEFGGQVIDFLVVQPNYSHGVGKLLLGASKSSSSHSVTLLKVRSSKITKTSYSSFLMSLECH